jgi:hypothetical protein
MKLSSKITAAAAALALALAALPASALASYRVTGTEYGITTFASNNTSPPFARNVERAVVAKFEHGHGWQGRPFAANVYSPTTHKTYRVRFFWEHGTTWPVIAWTNTHAWVRVYYGN